MDGLSLPCSFKQLNATTPNCFKHSGATSPLIFGSIILFRVPFRRQYFPHSAKLTCSLGSPGIKTGLAHNTSSRTTPNEYTSDLSVSFWLR
ncbi:hypothetical protein HanIR_Chr09g0431401 [Helianthus annuus]|nr:hypothetical protein HanIR_Chr09g0431401 [Helianthus annuus]